MSSKESTPIKKTSKIETKKKKVNISKGEIKAFDRRTYNYMKRQLKLPEAEVLKMTIAEYPAKINKMATSLCLFFDPEMAKEKGIVIEDYVTLNQNPELILYEGYYVRRSGGQIIIKKWEGVGTSLVEEKIKQGIITEVGINIPKTASQIWMGRLGKFMLMGGFMLVLVLMVAIALVISLLAKSC